jgi:hypothetical protein
LNEGLAEAARLDAARDDQAAETVWRTIVHADPHHSTRQICWVCG